MTTSQPDPFADPTSIVPDPPPSTEYSLEVGRDVSLTLGTDSLIVLDEGSAHFTRKKCCGLALPYSSSPTRAIPYFNVLSAEISELDILIRHASPVSKAHVRVSVVAYPIDKSQLHTATDFCARLLDRAYGAAQQRRRIKVLINPFGGQGSAEKLYRRDIEPIFAAANCHVDIVRTQYSGHAVELAEGLDIDAWDVVACVSGDGLPHEVFNGLGRRKDATRALKNVAVAQLPAGSGNAMSLNLNGTDSPSIAALTVIKGFRIPMDLVSVTQEDKRFLSFLSQSVGIVAETDLGTENLRWMGDARFTFGVLVRLLGKTVYPADIAVKCVDDDKASIKQRYASHRAAARTHCQASNDSSSDLLPDADDKPGPIPALRYGTVRDPIPPDWELRPHNALGNFYAGNMPYMARDANFFAGALPNDGCLDLVTIDGDISRLAALNVVLAVGQGKLFDLPHVFYRKVEAYRIIPRQRFKGTDGFISIDGEKVPFLPFQVEVHQGLGTVLARSGKGYESPPLN